MNKVYKVIWNKAKHCYEVVSELAKSQGKSAQDKRMRRISMRAAAVLAAFLVSIGGGTINLVQAADTTASAQVNAEQKAEKAATPLTADELKKQLDRAGIKAGNVENSANVISIGTKSSVTFDKYYGDANHDGKIDVLGIGPWNAIAIGQSATVHNSANAIGIGGGAGGGETVVDNSVGAVGIGTHTQIKDSQQASAYGIDSGVTNSAGGISYGAGSKITDSKLATALGYATNVTNSLHGVALGQRASVTDSRSGLALGDTSSVKNSEQSVAIGNYSQVYNKSLNSVALGAFSTVNGESGVISVGHKAKDLYPLDSTGKDTYGSDLFRRVINVADGKDAHDVATVGQVENGYVAYDTNKDGVDKGSVSFGGVKGSGTELKNVSGITFKGPNNNMILTGTAGGKAQVKNAGNSIVLSTLGEGAGQNRPQTTISDTNEAISIGNSNTVTVDKNSDFYKNNQPYWFNGNVAVGTQVELTNAGESVGLGSSTEVKDSIASTAVGYASSVKKSAFSAGFGDHSKVESGTYSTAIGAYSEVKNAIGSVALGAHTSVDGQNNVVSVGNAASGSYKRIVNMADGIEAHDAVTVGQVENGYVAYDTTNNTVNPGSVTFKGTTQKVNDKDVNIGTKLNNVNDISFNVPVYERIDDKDAPKADPSIGSYDLKTDGSTVTGYESRSLASTGLLPGKVSGDNGKGNNIALGRTTSIDGAHAGAIAVGKDATVIFDDKFSKEPNKGTESPNDAISIGTRTKNYNSYSGIALGASSGTWQSNWATALGTDSHVDNSYYGTAAGVFAKVENSPEGLALGRSAYVKGAPGSVALGSQSVADESGVISVGHTADDLRRDGKPYGDDLKRRITNVADGKVAEGSHDAVTGGQLFDVSQKVTDLDSLAVKYDSADKSSVTFGGSNGTTLKNVNDVEINVKGGSRGLVSSGITPGTVYAKADGWSEGAAADTASLAIGGGLQNSQTTSATVRGKNSIAIGSGASVDATAQELDAPLNGFDNADGVAIGVGANVSGIQGTAVGYGATVKENQGTAFGNQSVANGNKATAIGFSAVADADNSTVLGQGASVGTGADNSVALGAGSVVVHSDLKDTDKNGVVSVGSGNAERRIIHVANGVADTDAATVGQLNAKVKGASSKVEAKDKNITVESKTDENGTIYTVGLSNNLDLTNGSISFGTTGPKLDGKGLTINNVTYVSDAGLNAGGKAITGVGIVKNDTDAANKKYVDDSIKNAGISKDPSGDVTIGGTEGAGKVTVHKDGSASISGTKGNGFTANADGSNTVSGTTNFTGNVTINSQQIATGADVSGIQKQIGYDEKTNTYTKIDNGAATVIDGINKNTAAIKTNTDNIGATGKDGKLSLDNKATTVEAGINKNTADIAHNAVAIQQNQESITALGGAVSELDTRVDRVGAGAAALAALHPLDYDPANKWDFAAGYGHYKGANAVSVGTYYRPNENTMFSVGGSFGGGENMVNAGVSFKLGGGSGVTTSRTAMAAEINSLKDSNKALADNNKVLTDKVAAQDKKLADYDQKMKDMEAKLEALLKAQKQ